VSYEWYLTIIKGIFTLRAYYSQELEQNENIEVFVVIHLNFIIMGINLSREEYTVFHYYVPLFCVAVYVVVGEYIP